METTLAPDEFDSRFLNRELSWLEFNARVLALAEDADLPLLERVKFVAIFADNLDEFDSRFLNRELSWLEFNARVLALAEDADLPLLERVKFVAIFADNLDEFFQIRVAGLQEQVEAEVTHRTPDG